MSDHQNGRNPNDVPIDHLPAVIKQEWAAWRHLHTYLGVLVNRLGDTQVLIEVGDEGV